MSGVTPFEKEGGKGEREKKNIEREKKRTKKKRTKNESPFKKEKKMGVTPENGCHPRRIDVEGDTL